MINWTELRLGCRGLLLIARFDQQFMRYFDRSAAGALRSFQLALLTFPFYLLQVWLELDNTVSDAAQYLAGRSVGYAFNWMAFPLILLSAARLLDREQEMPGCIAIYNWLSLAWLAFQIPTLLLFAVDRDSSAAVALSYLFLLYSILIEGYLFVRLLRIPAWQSAVLVGTDVALNLFVIWPLSRALGYGNLL